ncbi:unnamed protein product [Fusarium langsethiae]|nr:unnamed protein product [Fusarium langsethiae]
MTATENVIEKYATERDKRIRPENLQQLSNFRESELAGMDQDLYIDHEALRAQEQPLKNGSEVRVLIIGAGIHGIVMAHRLVTEGVVKSEDLVLVDRAGGYGGTWYWNRYPGAMCDVEGYCYLPLLEETGYVPAQRYPIGKEIREQCERVARQFNLKAQFGTTTTHHQWDEGSSRWIVSMTQDNGPGNTPKSLAVKAQFLVLAGGVLPTPQIPKLNGLNVFRSVPGKTVMHTARWDWVSSGGSQEKPNMTEFKNKTIGIIGTGATAIQVIPHVVKWAKHVFVFQRTPAYVGPHSQKATTKEEWEKVARKKGWQYERQANLDASNTRESDTIDLIQDGWSGVTGIVALTGSSSKTIKAGEEEAHARAMVELDLPWTEKMRRRVDEEVKDPAVADKLKAWYPAFCKRPAFHDNYLSSFNRPNVTLVDTDGTGVKSYTANGVIANGQEYEFDVLILATGYTNTVHDPCPEGSINAPVVGHQQRTLRDKYESKDFGALFGTVTNGFPNLFFFTPSGSGAGVNLTPSLEINAQLATYMIKQAFNKASSPEKATVEVSKQAEDEYTAKVAERSRWFSALPNCTPSFFVQAPSEAKKVDAELRKRKFHWGGGILDFQRMVDAWKAAGNMHGVEVQG